MHTRVIARVDQLGDSNPFLVTIEDRTLGIYKVDGKLLAYENICPHQGGPVCEGELTNRVDASVTKGVAQERLSKETKNIACPWHGIVYDMETGACLADPTMTLTRVEVWQEGDDIKAKL